MYLSRCLVYCNTTLFRCHEAMVLSRVTMTGSAHVHRVLEQGGGGISTTSITEIYFKVVATLQVHLVTKWNMPFLLGVVSGWLTNLFFILSDDRFLKRKTWSNRFWCNSLSTCLYLLWHASYWALFRKAESFDVKVTATRNIQCTMHVTSHDKNSNY